MSNLPPPGREVETICSDGLLGCLSFHNDEAVLDSFIHATLLALAAIASGLRAYPHLVHLKVV